VTDPTNPPSTNHKEKRMSNDFSFEKYEGSIYLGADHRKGLWANQIATRHRRATRNGGQLPTASSSHTLHVWSLLNSLRDITKADAAKLIASPKGTVIAKPRVLVTAMDPSFLDALQLRMQGQKSDTKPLRAGKNFLTELARQLVRFEITFQTDTANTTCYSLKNWLERALPDPKLLSTIPQSLMPSVTSAVI
jgi:hypothetical protein